MKTLRIAIAFLAISCNPRTGPVPAPDSGPPEARAKDAGVPDAVAPAPAGSWSVHFSPHGGCTDAVVAAIDGAKESVWVQAYSFTSPQVADALVRAYGRTTGGKPLDVRVILDKSNRGEAASKMSQLTSARVPTWVDAKHAIAHNKVVIIDHRVLETGSFNYTAAAENNNAENCLIEDAKDKATAYEQNWLAHQGHSDPAN